MERYHTFVQSFAAVYISTIPQPNLPEMPEARSDSELNPADRSSAAVNPAVMISELENPGGQRQIEDIITITMIMATMMGIKMKKMIMLQLMMHDMMQYAHLPTAVRGD